MAQKKILIVVKAYPEPSTKYRSAICMAGITEQNEWIRLYPIDRHVQEILVRLADHEPERERHGRRQVEQQLGSGKHHPQVSRRYRGWSGRSRRTARRGTANSMPRMLLPPGAMPSSLSNEPIIETGFLAIGAALIVRHPHYSQPIIETVGLPVR